MESNLSCVSSMGMGSLSKAIRGYFTSVFSVYKVQRNDRELHLYDLHIVHSSSYRVPVLYFRGYNCEFIFPKDSYGLFLLVDGQPLALDDIKKDLPYHSSKILKDSRWTFMTQEEHPYLNRPWYALHPCGTSDWMKLLFDNEASVTENEEIVQQYLLSWLSVVGQVVGLRTPLEVFSKNTQCHVLF
ncbi:hypothetical protein IFM89_029834 [Coptis chinensis]|uniref:Ubiquitin-like-conjugating enzyme ATG10 n=1 Tax=Coptis chinensis TaxID=261450 RepID=A0A835HN68_9MAGN|nr:hypothetical protein IFM89_029834 [Coptis chinensis]